MTTSSEQHRELGLRLFSDIPGLCKAIRDKKCFRDLIPIVRRYKEEVLAILLATDIPAEWAFRWLQQWPEDRDKLRKFVIDSRDAFHWSLQWPEDRDKLRKFVIDSRDAFRWSLEWPEDRDNMRKFVTDSWDAMRWLQQWPEDRDKMENTTGTTA